METYALGLILVEHYDACQVYWEVNQFLQTVGQRWQVDDCIDSWKVCLQLDQASPLDNFGINVSFCIGPHEGLLHPQRLEQICQSDRLSCMIDRTIGTMRGNEDLQLKGVTQQFGIRPNMHMGYYCHLRIP